MTQLAPSWFFSFKLLEVMILNALPALVLALLPLAFAQDNDTTAVLQDLMNAKIIPNVVPQFTPLYPLDVVFTDGTGSKFPVTAGSNLTSNRAWQVSETQQSGGGLTFLPTQRLPIFRRLLSSRPTAKLLENRTFWR